jgi:cytochrome d ubiquinol oxidase subunit II
MTAFWFIVLAFLWVGFLVLEGFDFGVGMLHSIVGRDEAGRGVAMGTIGPVWDGNEVWLITAGAITFAAFPGWYATMFSGLYLALVLLLAALILRGVSFEFREHRSSVRWRRGWSAALAGGSLVAPLLVGVALADLLYGLPIAADQEFVGDFWDLLSVYSVLSGVTLVVICLLLGTTFLALKTAGDIRDRAWQLARWFAPVCAILVLTTIIWTHVLGHHGVLLSVVELAGIVAVLAAVWLVAERRDGWAFTAAAVTMAGVVFSFFTNLYPRVMVSTLGPANDLTVHNVSSAPYALKVMTVITVVFLPAVIAYQAYTYWVFRHRLRRPAATPTPP